MNTKEVAHIVAGRLTPMGSDDSLRRVILDEDIIGVEFVENGNRERFFFRISTEPTSEIIADLSPDALPKFPPQVDRASEASEDENAHATGPQPLAEDAPRTPESGPPGMLKGRRG